MFAFVVAFLPVIVAQAQGLTVPSAPQDVVATAEDGGVVLDWSAPSDNGGSAILRYEVRSAEGASVPESADWTSNGTFTSRAFRQLTHGTQYSFEVRAVNAQGAGPAVQVQATPDKTPSVPRGLTATPGDGEVVLRWSPPADNGGFDVVYYSFRGAEGASVPWNTPWRTTSETSGTLRQLTNGTLYTFEVRAENAQGAGRPAQIQATPEGTVPSAPRDVVATAEDGGVVLKWSPPADSGSSIVTRYEMRGAAGASVPESTPWISTGTRTSGALRQLTNGTLYTFEVRAVNKNGGGPAAEVQATPGLAPSAPRNLEATPGHGQVTLEWDAPADRGSTAITDYELRYAEGTAVPSETAWNALGPDGTDRFVAVDHLTNGRAYAFEVRAVNASGAGDAAAVTATPVQHPTVTVRPEQAAYRFAEGASETGVVIVAQGEPGGDRPLDAFRVAVTASGVTGGATFPSDVEPLAVMIDIDPEDFTATGGIWQASKSVSLSIVDDALDEDDEEFQVKVGRSVFKPPWLLFREADGRTACGEDDCVVTITIEDNDRAPSAPRNLMATAEDGGIVLRWSPPASNGGSNVTRYETRGAAGASVPESTPWVSTGTRTSGAFRQLTNGTLYSFEVRAVNARGAGPAARIQATPGAPTVPQDVIATAEDGGIVLRWSAPANSYGSAIRRYETRGAEGASVPESTPWISTGTRTSGAFRNLTNGTLHSFEVRAVNARGAGPAARVQATPGLAPSAPRNLEAEPGDGAVTLEWQAPSSNGGSPVTGYEYRHAEGSSVADETAWTSVGTALTVTIGSLVNGTGYAFEVRAVNAVGGGEIAALTATPAVAPSAPRNLEAEPGDGAVTLKWQAPSSNGGSPVTGYEYRHAEGSSVADETAWTSVGTDLTVTIGSLVNDTQYAFEVRAENAVGKGEIAALTATPAAAATVPSAPRNLEAEPGDGEVKLTWAAPSSNGGSPVTGYEYRHAEGSSVADETAWTSVGTALTVTIGSLTNDTQYAFEVRAVNAVGEGSAATLTATPVQHPTVTVRPEQAAYRFVEGASGAGVAIAAQGEPGGGRPNETFRVTVSSKPIEGGAESPDDYGPLSETISFSPEDFTAAGGIWQARKTVALAIVDDALDEDDEDLTVALEMSAGLQSWVRLREADGRTACGTDGCIAKVTIEDNDRAPSAPRNLMATRGDGAVTLEWQAPADPGTLAVTGYEYRHAEGTTVPDETGWTSADAALSVEIGGLIEGTVYTFQVRAVSDAGGGEIAALTATPAVAPSAPQSLEAEPGDGEVKLTWAAPSSNGGSPVTGYEYRHAEGSSVADETEWTSVGAALTVTVGSLVNGTGYAFEVRAVNAVGGGEIAALGATPAVAPSAPQNLEAEPGDGEVKLTWAAPSSNGGSPVTGYEYRHAEGSSVADETEWTSVGTDLTVTIGSLANDTEYAFEVRAVNAVGGGEIAALTATPVRPPAVGPAANGLAITPVPPAASADHGPYYTKDDFLALPEGAVHGTGATLTFTLTLDTEVTVTGSPELVLDIHDRERRARYTGGSGTRQLTFVWTVAKGDNDPDGLEVGSLDLKGGTIRDSEERDLVLDSVASHSFPEHRVRGGLFAMRLEATGSAREGEPFEIRVIRDGGYDEPAVAVAGVTDSALPHIPQRSSPALNGPGVRQFDFQDGEPGEPGVRVSTRTVTPLGDGVADGERTLTVRLTATDAGIHRHTGQSIQAWYLVEEPLEVTVPVIDTGQPLAEAGLQVHDTSATEAPGAKLVFRVTLSPRSEGTVTVGYRTGDNPPNARGATAGQDYVPTEGMLTFEPGDTLKTVEVEVLPDDHDDRLETMRLILSNAQGARIDKAVGRGIIRNDGPIPRAWLARFGRTVADQVLDAVESRMEAARQPGVEMTLAGQRVGGEEGRTPEPETAVRLSDKPRAVRGATSRDLLSGTSFTATAETGRGGYVSLWGRGAVTRFDGREGSLTLDGEVASAMAGVDWAHENWTAGLIVSRSVAEGGYTGHSGGRVEATLTGLYPWGRIALSDRVDGWGAAGYGTGELSVTPRKPGTAEDAATVRTDLDLRMAAAGLRGDLVDGGGDGLTLTAKTDASIVETASDAARGPGGGSLAAASASVTRLRLGLEGSRPIPLGGGEALIPSAEIGARHDGGDAETGFGVDLGGGLAWTAPGRGLRIELRGRGLLAHEARGFRERGFSGSLAWDPAPSSESGPKATVAQTVGGPASGGADTLLARGTLAGLGASPGADGGGDLGTRRLEAKFGYGFATRGGRFASVPEIGLGLSDSGRDFSLGWRLVPDGAGGPGAFQLSAEARRHETDGGDRPPEHSIGLRLSARW